MSSKYQGNGSMLPNFQHIVWAFLAIFLFCLPFFG